MVLNIWLALLKGTALIRLAVWAENGLANETTGSLLGNFSYQCGLSARGASNAAPQRSRTNLSFGVN